MVQEEKLLMWFMLACICFLITSCSSNSVQKDVDRDLLIRDSHVIVLDSSLIEPCEDLQPLTKTTYTQKQFLNVLKDWVYKYKTCQKRHEELSNWAQQAAGLKPQQQPIQ